MRRRHLFAPALLAFSLTGSVPRSPDELPERTPGTLVAEATASVDALAPAGSAGGEGAESAASVEPVPDAPARLVPEVPNRRKDPPLPKARSLPRADDLLSRAKRNKEGRWVVEVEGRKRVLTIVPALQEQLTGIMARYETPYAAVAVIEPATGRVLALAEHSQVNPSFRGLPLKAAFPAASIFKVVTAGALLEAGVKADDTACSFGGFRNVTARHLEDTPRDNECFSLSRALGISANAVFAKLTVNHLDQQTLLETAERFGFNRAFDFPMPLEPSLAAVPGDKLGLGETGAGFGDVFLSPLHGALLAAVPANGGLLRAPVLFEDQASPEPSRVLDETHAALLGQMLEETVTHGTARRIFRERGYRVKGAVGKTGSLADKRPFRDYSWFVGYAPKEAPKIAVAAVIVNEPRWRIRGTWLGREALRLGLASLPEAPVIAGAPEIVDPPPPSTAGTGAGTGAGAAETIDASPTSNDRR